MRNKNKNKIKLKSIVFTPNTTWIYVGVVSS